MTVTAPSHEMAVRPLRQGRVQNDQAVHAFLGLPPRALCGAGVMVERLGGWFDRESNDACANCTAAIDSPQND